LILPLYTIGEVTDRSQIRPEKRKKEVEKAKKGKERVRKKEIEGE